MLLLLAGQSTDSILQAFSCAARPELGPCLTLFCICHLPRCEPQNNNDQGIGLGQEMMEMLQKMKTQDYKIPESLNLTPECCKLLHAMLQPSIDQRMKMAGIMSDPWFLTHLPPNAINMNDGYLAKPRPCAQTEADIRAIVKQAARS
jgi:serine/threonine-protein kinase SRK2